MKSLRIKVSEIFEKIHASKHRYTINHGGTRSGKTYSQLIDFYIRACETINEPFIYSVCSESLPHLKRGAMRDFFSFLKNNNLYNEKCHNRTNNYYEVGKSIIEFFGVEDSGKVHGASRDFLFLNEIQFINYETAFQLFQRTNQQIFLDFNPTHDFWGFKELLENPAKQNDILSIHSTIYDNPFVSKHILKDVEDRAAKDENYRNVYLLGKKGTLDGLIFPNFKIIQSIPEQAKILGIGIDFGFNDPMTAIEVYRYENNLYFNELFYETEKLTSDLIRVIADKKSVSLFPDSADAAAKRELQNKGFKIFNINKGTITSGLNLMKQYNLFITCQSVNTISEFRNYSWLKNKNGETLDVPVDFSNHAIDAARYVCISTLLNSTVRHMQKAPDKIKKYAN